MVIMTVLRIEEVRVGRVHPPCVDVVINQGLQILPVDLTCLLTECVVYSYAARIIHPRRPECADTALWPCLEIVHEVVFSQFLECLCLRTETCPYTYHDMCIVAMYLVDHPCSVCICVCEEVHGVPCVVAAPVLPVLDDSVERYIVGSMPAYNLEELVD